MPVWKLHGAFSESCLATSQITSESPSPPFQSKKNNSSQGHGASHQAVLWHSGKLSGVNLLVFIITLISPWICSLLYQGSTDKDGQMTSSLSQEWELRFARWSWSPFVSCSFFVFKQYLTVFKVYAGSVLKGHPGSAQKTIWDPRGQTWSTTCKTRQAPCLL